MIYKAPRVTSAVKNTASQTYLLDMIPVWGKIELLLSFVNVIVWASVKLPFALLLLLSFFMKSPVAVLVILYDSL